MALYFQLNGIIERVAPEPYRRYARVVFDHKLIKGAPLSLSYFRLTPGQHGPKHTHKAEVEVYLTIKGTGKVTLGDDIVEMTPGTIVYVPPEIEHQTFNTGDVDFEFYGVFSPSVDFTEILCWERASTQDENSG